MIISHTHRYIFLKTNKTAGTSVEIALSKFCGAEDVIAPISRVDEETRRSLGYRGAQHDEVPLRLHPPARRVLAALGGKRLRYYNHMTADEVRRCVEPEVWRTYFKFCIERNPWDRVVSLYYYWVRGREPAPSLAEFVRTKVVRQLITRGRDVYTIGGEIAVDTVCLYERLDADLESVRTRLGIPEPLTLPRAKGGFRPERKHYSELYDEDSRAVVEEMFRPEIERFGYTF